MSLWFMMLSYQDRREGFLVRCDWKTPGLDCNKNVRRKAKTKSYGETEQRHPVKEEKRRMKRSYRRRLIMNPLQIQNRFEMLRNQVEESVTEKIPKPPSIFTQIQNFGEMKWKMKNFIDKGNCVLKIQSGTSIKLQYEYRGRDRYEKLEEIHQGIPRGGFQANEEEGNWNENDEIFLKSIFVFWGGGGGLLE